MTSTRKYDIDHINAGKFINVFRKERPELKSRSAGQSDEECERLSKKLIQAIQNALSQSAPEMVPQERAKQTIINRVPRTVGDLFIIASKLVNESRRQARGQNNYTRSNYSKTDFFNKNLAFYIGDQCPNQLVNKKYRKPNSVQVDEELIKEIFGRLPENKLPGLDFIPNEVWSCILKCDEEYLIQFISSLIKSYYYFPKAFKQSKIIAFRKPYRRGFDPENYRFITIQSSICKIYERLLLAKLKDQNLYDYLNRVDNQHGFTRKKSRFTALNTVVDEMREIKRTRQFGILIQLDISRAFDLISWDHIMKVTERNLNSEKCIIIAQLLKDRTVKLNECERKTRRGLPQGSASSHLLWLIATSDLMLNLSAIQGLVSVGFVDDLMLVVKGNSQDEVIRKVNETKSVLESWLKSACLRLNESKCVYMQFNGPKLDLNRLGVEINGVRLRGVGQIRYLGTLLDRNLSFNPQMIKIHSKVRDAIRAVQAILAYQPTSPTNKDRLQIYQRAIVPLLLNGWNVWGKSVVRVKRYTDQLRNLQKKCLATLFNEAYMMKNSDLCRKYRIFPIDLELQVKIDMKARSDQLQRRLTSRECQDVRLRVQQQYHFHFDFKPLTAKLVCLEIIHVCNSED